MLTSAHELRQIEVPASDGEGIAWLHARGNVIGQELAGDTVRLQVRLSNPDFSRFQARSFS